MKHTDVVIKSTKSGLILHVKFEQLKKKEEKKYLFLFRHFERGRLEDKEGEE